MGQTKKIHLAEKNIKKEMDSRVDKFKEEVLTLGKKYKFKIVPFIRKGNLAIDVVCFGTFFQRFKKNEFRESIFELSKKSKMTIVPVFDRYSLGVEIQVSPEAYVEVKKEQNNNEIERENKENLGKVQ